MQVEVNGTLLWFDVDGFGLVPEGAEMRERPKVVLLPGGPGSFDHSYFKPDFSRLASAVQVVYLDLRGHGRTAWGSPAEWTFELCADDLRAFCDTLGVVKPIVFGHSLGGFVAYVYAAPHPGHAAAFVLQSTCACFNLPRIVEAFRRKGGEEVAEIVARSYQGDPSVTAEEWSRCWDLFGPWVPREQEKARTLVNQELNAPGLKAMLQFDVRDQLGQVTRPALVCVGELDPNTPVEAAREIVQALPQDLAELAVLEDAGHVPWRDVPDRYWALVTGFIGRAVHA